MKRLLTATTLLCMAGCTVFQNHARREVSLIGPIGAKTNILATTADVRLVTERTRAGSDGMSILCTEPSPDVAKAISAAGSFNANGGNTNAKGQIAVAGGSAEAVAELAGRSTALLALRDGLYHTCEAYANGALGPDAYALVLARYGQLMTTLFLAQDLTSAVAGVSELDAARANASSPNPGVPSSNSSSSQENSDSTQNSQQGSTGAKNPPATSPSAQSAADLPAADPPAADPPAADPPAAPQQAKQAAAAPANPPTKPNTSGNSTTQPAAPAAASVAAVALARMNEDYADLDLNPLQLLVVACVNQGDPSRTGNEKNTWLATICNNLADPDKMGSLMKVANASVASFGRPGPALDLVAAMTGGKGAAGTNLTPTQPPATPPVTPSNSASNANNPAAKAKKSASNPQLSASKAKIQAAQWALLALGYNVGRIDGVVGPQTHDAIRLFQVVNNLSTKSGELDAVTLGALLLPANRAANAQQSGASGGK